jgi:hypothetical protein
MKYRQRTVNHGYYQNIRVTDHDHGRVGRHRGADVTCLRKCRIQVQGISYKSFGPCQLHASTFYSRNGLATVRVIFPPGVAIHVDRDVNGRVTGGWWLGVRRMVAVWIPRVLSVRLHNNWHIRAMVLHEIGSRVRHSAIGNVRRVILVGRGKRIALTLVLLSGMGRRGWLHRYVVGGMVRRGLSRLVHGLHGRVLSVDRKWVTHRAHERWGWGCASSPGHPIKWHAYGWRGRRVRLDLASRSCATS